jgi:hypothetical protein
MALTSERQTPKRDLDVLVIPVAANVKCFAGGLAVVAAGYVKPGATATGLVTVGRFRATVDNTGGQAGDVSAEVEPGCFRYLNSAGADAITQAEVGTDCYVVDDQTVAKTNGSNTRSVAGKVVAVDALGVWVKAGL